MQRQGEAQAHARQDGQEATAGPPENGGRGECPKETQEMHLTPVQENQIVSRMIHFDHIIWPFERQDYIDGVATTRRNMKSEDGRVSNRATSNFLKMTDQNLKVKDGAQPAAPVSLNINFNGATIDINHASVEDLRKLPRSELVRIYRDTLRAPEEGQGR